MTFSAGATLVSVGLPVLRADGTGARPMPVPSSLAGVVESAWLEVLSELLARGPVTVACLARDRGAVSRAVSVARQLLETPGIALVPLDSAPLAAAVVVDAAARTLLAGGLSVNDLPRFLRHAGHGLLDVAVVPSVADLELPGLGLSHHVASYLPGKTQFLVQLAPMREVNRLKPDRVPRHDGLIPMDGGAWTATAMGGSGLPAELVGWLHSRGVPLPPVLPSDGSVTGWWRSDAAVELVVHPADSATWVHFALATATERTATTCAWCGAPGVDADGTCVFCHQSTAASPA